MQVIDTVFSEEQLSYLQNLPEVLKAREKLSKQNIVYFSVAVTPTIKQAVYESFGIDLFGVNEIPFRWIKGDTAPHVDRGQAEFDNTYLVYLTDGDGQFILGDDSYPIQAGTGFSFSEGLSHSVVGSNGGARLLLGPMSEQGFAVGGFQIYADGATDTVYIADIGGTVSYKINDGEWTAVIFACYVGNSNPDPTNNILKVLFTTDITLTDWNQNFWAGTAGIQFGSETMNVNGERPFIIIDNAPLYRGVILNGNSGGGGYDNIYVYNLRVSASGTSTLDDGTWSDGKAGWVGGAYFGIGASNNYIVNCSSDGPIGDSNGGIVGSNAADNNGTLRIYGCHSTGTMGNGAGGIVGAQAASNAGSVTCEQCWSEGAIGQYGGGIFGEEAGYSYGYAEAIKCYSKGTIGDSAGGIFGRYAGNGVDGSSGGETLADTCYSEGDISASGGGIYGRQAGVNGGTTSASNCYTTGAIGVGGQAGGIYGEYMETGIAFNCYTTGIAFNETGFIYMDNGTVPPNCYSEAANSSSGWNNIHATFALLGTPGTGVGTYWVYRGINTPYELNAIGYTPYQLNNIDAASELIQSFSGTVQAGLTTPEAAYKNTDPSGNDFTILQITGGDSGSYPTITMSSQTGAISTTADTVPETYTITLRSIGSYNITIYILLVTQGSPEPPEPTPSVTTTACCQTETFTRDISYEWLNDYRIGRRLVAESAQNPNLRFYDYSEYIKYKMALGSGKL